MGPPQGWVGGWVPWRVVLSHTDDIYALITEVEAFPSGVQFTLASRFRPGNFDLHPGPWREMLHPGQPGGRMFGVGFADGRRAMVGRPFPPPFDDEPTEPVLTLIGGGGGGEEWRMGMWLWPLPPPGPLTFVASWAEQGQEERATTVDATELINASRRAEQLWLVDDGAPSGHIMGVGSASAQATIANKPDHEELSTGSA